MSVTQDLATAYNRDPLAQNNFVLKRQLMKLVGGRFFIHTSSGAFAFLADRKGFKLKEEIRVYRDEAMTQPFFGIFARQVIDVSATYDVVDLATNVKFGALKRMGLRSILRDKWLILDASDQEIGYVEEDSVALALIRRFLTNLIPQNYDGFVGGQRVADFRQNFNPFTYNLNIEFMVGPEAFDRRIGLATAVLLAAIEGRQKG
jgi:hypothetical protein